MRIPHISKKWPVLLLLVSFIWLTVLPEISLAYYNRGTVRVLLGAASISVPVSGTVTVSAIISPAFYEGVLGCGLPQCPQECTGNCGDEVTGQCTCAGDARKREDARVTVGVGNAFIAKASYSNGVISIEGISAGTTSITIQATLWQHTDSPMQTINVLVTEPVQALPSFAPPPEVPGWTPQASATPPASIGKPAIPTSSPGGGGQAGGALLPPSTIPESTLPPRDTGGPQSPSPPDPSPTPPGSNTGLQATPAAAEAINPFAAETADPTPEASDAYAGPVRTSPPTGSLERSFGNRGVVPGEGGEVQEIAGESGFYLDEGPGLGAGSGTDGPGSLNPSGSGDGLREGGGSGSQPGLSSSSSPSDQAREQEEQQEEEQDIMSREGPVIVVTLKDEGPTGKEEMERAKQENGRVIFQKLDESGNVVYSWTFRGAEITAPADIDMRIELPEALPALEPQTKGLVNPQYIVFAHRGELPGKAEIYININSRYDAGDILALHELDPGREQPENAASDLPVKGGYASFELEEIGEAYALSAGEAWSLPQQAAVILSIALLLLVTGFIAAALAMNARRKRALKDSQMRKPGEEE